MPIEFLDTATAVALGELEGKAMAWRMHGRAADSSEFAFHNLPQAVSADVARHLASVFFGVGYRDAEGHAGACAQGVAAMVREYFRDASECYLSGEV